MGNKETLQSYNNKLNANNTSLNGILDIINELPEASGEINLQDKTVEITDNGTQTIKADSGYDGLNEVEVITNVASSGGGGETPEKGIVIRECDTNGYATKIELVGFTSLPDYALGCYSTHSFSEILTENLTEVILNEGLTKVGQACFANCRKLIKVNFPTTIKALPSNMFYSCTSLKIKTLPDTITSLNYGTFRYCELYQLSFNNVTKITASNMTQSPFERGRLYAIWIGSAIATGGLGHYALYCDGGYKLKKIFINLPRATVEAMANYSVAFSDNQVTTDIIICNDDEGFMTKEQFDAIDWSTYTE